MLAHKYSEEFFITTKKEDFLLNDVLNLLKLTHWACNRPEELVLKSIENSLCFGVLKDEKLVGFARVITDYSTFGYICDVVIDPNYRGQQLGHWLIKTILNFSELDDISQWRLKTTYAHSFYKTLGFTELKHPEKHLELCDEY